MSFFAFENYGEVSQIIHQCVVEKEPSGKCSEENEREALEPCRCSQDGKQGKQSVLPPIFSLTLSQTNLTFFTTSLCARDADTEKTNIVAAFLKEIFKIFFLFLVWTIFKVFVDIVNIASVLYFGILATWYMGF